MQGRPLTCHEVTEEGAICPFLISTLAGGAADKVSLFWNTTPCSLVVKGKAVPLQAWSGPEGPRKLRFPNFVTSAQDGG